MIGINSSGETVVWFHLNGNGPDTSRYKITISLELWLANATAIAGEQSFRTELFTQGAIERS